MRAALFAWRPDIKSFRRFGLRTPDIGWEPYGSQPKIRLVFGVNVIF